ncbi:hypothetical protein TPAU25S_01119 [Tsukamurella paurometabola]|nr:Uncharacterised protein [Tsukamurella paurometabola]
MRGAQVLQSVGDLGDPDIGVGPCGSVGDEKGAHPRSGCAPFCRGPFDYAETVMSWLYTPLDSGVTWMSPLPTEDSARSVQVPGAAKKR